MTTDLLAEYARLERERDDARAGVEQLRRERDDEYEIRVEVDRRLDQAYAGNERLREELELSVQLRERVEAEYERELDRLRAALQDAATYLRLGMTWTVDTDRHVKLKAAWERAKKACDDSS